jgi:serine protease AprX
MKRIMIGFCLALAAVAAAVYAADGPFSRSQRGNLFARVPAIRIQADTDGNRLFDNLEAQLATVAAEQTLPVIVRYRPGREPAPGAVVGRGARRLALDRSVATRLTRAEIQQLTASDAIESIEADVLCTFTRDTAVPTFGVTNARTDFGLDGDGDGDPHSYSAQDHTIAVIDTGIDGNHQDFAGGKIIAWYDWINGRSEPYDEVGHGTHIASIAAGAVNAAGVGGVAPAAALVGLKVGNEEGAYISVIIQAVEWCIQNEGAYGIDVITLSLGSDGSSAGTDALSRAVNRAVAAGIVVCVAGGNTGPDLYTTGSPSAAAEVITVGSMADPGKDGFFLDPFSSRGPTADGRIKPDLCAPGEQILAARANSSSGYVRYSGTSMATPFVAGVAALMLQANPSLTPAEVKAMMKATAVHFGREGENNDFGAGRLDGYQAIARAAGKSGTGPTVPNHFSSAGRLQGTGGTRAWELSVSNTRFSIAATLIMESTTGDFDLGIFDPEGELAAVSASEDRQELTAFRPTRTGTYTVVIQSYAGAGDYTLDVSAGSNVPLLEVQ